MKFQNTHKDEVDWLISIYKNSVDEELKKEAYERLISFGLSAKEIEEKCTKPQTDEDEEKNFEKAWKIQSQRNEAEEYTFLEKIKIFFFGPLQLLRYFDSGLKGLYDLNYKTKFKQRLILLISGICFWGLFCIVSYNYYEHKRMQEIENTDISEWEKNRIK